MRARGSHDGTMVARACLAIVAVLAAAWLALSLRNDQLAISGLRAAVTGAAIPPGPERNRLLGRSISELRDSQLLNPDTTPALYEALARSISDPSAGAQQLVELSRSYPKDALVWASILRVLPPSDPRVAEARAQLRILIPQRPR